MSGGAALGAADMPATGGRGDAAAAAAAAAAAEARRHGGALALLNTYLTHLWKCCFMFQGRRGKRHTG